MDGLKQRIIGALVLVSLAVIFVPMLFDEPHTERTSTTISIPEEPPFPEVEAPEVEPPLEQSAVNTSESEAPDYRILEEAPQAGSDPSSGDAPAGDAVAPEDAGAEPEPVPTGSTQEPTEPEPAQTDTAGTTPAAADEPSEPATAEYQRSLEGAWVVQLGSFGNADNARRLRDRVREKGYGSHLQEVTQGGTTFTRVFSGPFATESEAQSAKRALDDAFGLNSLVTTGDK